LETEAVVFAAAVLIGEGVAEAETKWKEDAAKRAAVDAKRMLLILLPAVAFLLLLLLFTVEQVAAVVEFKRLIPAAAVDNARHEVGDAGEEEDGGCRSCPCTRVAADVAKAELAAVEVEVDTEVEVIVLLLRARHDDDNRAERVAVHAAQDAMIPVEYVAETTLSPNRFGSDRIKIKPNQTKPTNCQLFFRRKRTTLSVCRELYVSSR
jgi:hypothetical protein